MSHTSFVKNLLFLHLSSTGFTLVELMIVMAVIALLATLALFGLGKAQGAARDVQRQQIMASFRTALERYYGDNKNYTSAADFCAMVTATASYFGTAPTDPKTGTAICGSGNPTAGGATYTFTGGGAAPYTSYTLQLTKESGGTNSWSSPN